MFFYVTLGDPNGLENPPKMLSENLLIFDYLPIQMFWIKWILPFIMQVSGILMGCIEEGIPSLILPQDYDQFDNAVRAELFQVGLVSRKKTDSEVLRLFNELVSREDWSHLKALAQKSKAYQPTKILYQEIERLLKSEVIKEREGRDSLFAFSRDLLFNEYKKLERLL